MVFNNGLVMGHPSARGADSMDKEKGTQELSHVLDGLLGRRGLGKSHRQIEDVRTAWVRAAGEATAAHTSVRSLAEGVVWVDVDSAALCHRLAAFEKERLLVALTEELTRAHVTDIRFRLGAL